MYGSIEEAANMNESTKLVITKLIISDLVFQDFKLDLKTDAFRALIDSIGVNGVVIPIRVSKDNVILDGKHRAIAAKIVGMITIPCYIIDSNYSEVKNEIKLIRPKRYD